MSKEKVVLDSQTEELVVVLKEAGVTKPEDFLKLITNISEKSKEWEALSSIEVKDHNDLAAIKLAESNRLQVKRERGEANKFLKGKREEVQEKMRVYTIEDKAYLKIQQFFEAKAKKAEEELEEKAKTRERYEVAELARITEERTTKLSTVCDNASVYPVGTMTEEAFENMFNSFKVAKEQKEKEEEAAREAAEKARLKTELYNTRNSNLIKFVGLEYAGKNTLTEDTTVEEYESIVHAAVAAQKDKEERDALEKAAAERAESIRKSLYAMGLKFDGTNFTFDTVSTSMAEFATLKQPEVDAKVAQLKKDVDAAREKINAAQAKALAEAEALKKAATVVQNATVASPTVASTEVPVPFTTAAKTPKGILFAWVDNFVLPLVDEKLSPETVADIHEKFAGFKKWAKKAVNTAIKD